MTNIHEVEKIEFPSMTAFEKKHLARKRTFLGWLMHKYPWVVRIVGAAVALTLFDWCILPYFLSL